MFLHLLDSLPDDAVRFAAALAARVPGLAARVDPHTRRLWAAGGRFERCLAATVCGGAVGGDAEAAALLTGLARDESHLVRDLAQIGLAERAIAQPAAFADIAALSDSADVRDRAAAARSAVVILRRGVGGPVRGLAVQVVVAAFLDPADEPSAGLPRHALGELLVEIDPRQAAAVVRQLWNRPEPALRRRALSALTPKLLRAAEMSEELTAAASGTKGGIQAEAERALRRLGVTTPSSDGGGTSR